MQVRVCADKNENESIYLAIARLERNSHIEKTKVWEKQVLIVRFIPENIP